MVHSFVAAHTVAALLPKERKPLVDAEGKETVEHVLAKLEKAHLIGLPVYVINSEGKKFYRGFVNTIDIMTYIAFRSYDPSHPESTTNFVKETHLTEEIGNILGLTEEGQTLFTFRPSDPLEKLLEYFSKGVHRALVYSSEDDVQIVTQTDAIKFFEAHAEEFKDALGKTLKDANLVQGHVHSISHNQSALEGFRKAIVHGVSSVAILGEDGHSLLGTLTSSDLKGVKTSNLKNVLSPVMTFLNSTRKFEANVHAPTASVGEIATVAMVVQVMSAIRSHHVWVCKGSDPTGVISMTDVISLVYNAN